MLELTILILSVVALALPAQAQQLDATQMATARTKAQVCFACHGPDGNSTVGEYPILAGQTWRYIYIELKDFKEGRRSDPQMSPMAAKLSTRRHDALGNFFAAQKQAPIKFQVDAAKVEAGQARLPTRCSVRCATSAASSGRTRFRASPANGRSTSRSSWHDFKARRRTNDAGNMTSVAATLSDADIENLSQYIGNLY